jgi:hypothetical protein
MLFYTRIFVLYIICIFATLEATSAASTENPKLFRFMSRITITAHGFRAGDFNVPNQRMSFQNAVLEYTNVSSVDQYFLNTVKIAAFEPPATQIMFQLNCENLNSAQNVSQLLSIIHYDSYIYDGSNFNNKNNNTGNFTIPRDHVSFLDILNKHFKQTKNLKGKEKLTATKIELLNNFGVLVSALSLLIYLNKYVFRLTIRIFVFYTSEYIKQEYPIVNTTFLYIILSCSFFIGIYTVISSMKMGRVWDPLPDPIKKKNV